jgi:ABC-type branched-subunit amino acid transport system permease subunit
MCVYAIPALAFTLPGGVKFTTVSLTDAYYGILVVALGTFVLSFVVSSSRVGRAFHAIKENELLAEAQGVDALFYKMFAFTLGAAIAGVAGGYYATWLRVVCPALMGLPYTITLLIIVFIGGRGSLRGIALAAILCTILPEVLRISDSARLVIYGVLLLVFVLYIPGGLEGAIEGVNRLTTRRGGSPH